MREVTPGCSLVAFWACLVLRNNLQLALVYGVNGNKMEKYYIFGAFCLLGVCTIPVLVANEFGWYDANGLCWLRDPTPELQLHWLIATQSVPMLVMSTVEVISFLSIITFMVMRIQRLRADTSISSFESVTITFASSLPKHPIVQFCSMILRIALYPLLSCFLSTTACILDVQSVIDPTLSRLLRRFQAAHLMHQLALFQPLNVRILSPYVIDEFFLRC
ncbi:hypothetical protein B0H19DRAFT_1270095 [Mycena capillaripes]|nr:hypothetical protein B0H19DRAFT_1270095 [Mycena capillaripes]